MQETFVQVNKKFKEALHSFRSYSKNWKLTKFKITLCFDFGDKSCNEFCCNCYFRTSCTGNYKQFAYSVPSICNKFCKNMGHFLLNIDRCLMSSASVVFIIKCMRSKNVCTMYGFCFLFSLLSETKTFRLWTDKVIEYVAFSTKTFSIELCSYVPDRNINTDLSSCSTKLFKGQKHNQAIVSSAQACATR